MDGNSFRCVTAPEQLQDIKIPPGLTHRMARAFNPMYFKSDLDKDLTVGANLGGSSTRTSYWRLLAMQSSR
ncbi:unnamed protein product [Bathycoccus prasinos]